MLPLIPFSLEDKKLPQDVADLPDVERGYEIGSLSSKQHVLTIWLWVL